jgi:hypothetical protein
MSFREVVRIGPLLVLAALCGYLLGGCGGGGFEGFSGATELPSVALPTAPGVTVPDVTIPDVTLPDVTIPTLPEPPDTAGTTSEPTITVKPPITTEPATTVIKTETESETETVPTETAVAAPTLAETTPSEPSSDDDSLWAWVGLAVALLAAAVTLAVVLWRRRHREEGA